MAFPERLHPLAEGLLGADRQQDHPEVLGRLLDQALGEGEQGNDRGAVVVGAGHDVAQGDVGHRRRSACAEEDAELGEQPRAGERAEQRRAGPARTGAISGGLVSLRSISPRRSAMFGSFGMEDEARMGGVVVRRSAPRCARPRPRRARRRRCRWSAAAAPCAAAGSREGSPSPIPTVARAPRRRPEAASRAVPRRRRAPRAPHRLRAATSRSRARAHPRSAPARRLLRSARRATRQPDARLRWPRGGGSPRAARAACGVDRGPGASRPDTTRRLPWSNAWWRLDHPLPRPRHPDRGRLVVVPRPLPGDLLPVAFLRRRAR